ncbi:hypothetical protein NC651_037227 [Populus alba x Populus x berolinensis]|nr:hypothetical protein NC651_037227 [Populus alba x Populus x berolinensis]
MTSTTKKILWLRWLLTDMRVFFSHPTLMYFYNQSSIQIAHNLIFHERTKHIEIDCHLTRHHLQHDTITLPFVPSSLQITDFFTKAHFISHFHFLVGKLLMLVVATSCWPVYGLRKVLFDKKVLIFSVKDGTDEDEVEEEEEEGRGADLWWLRAVLPAVADQRMAWTVVGLSSSSLRFFLLLYSLLFLFSSSVSHGAVVNWVAACGDDDGGATVDLLCGGWQCFASVFPVCADALVSAFSSIMVLQRGKKMFFPLLSLVPLCVFCFYNAREGFVLVTAGLVKVCKGMTAVKRIGAVAAGCLTASCVEPLLMKKAVNSEQPADQLLSEILMERANICDSSRVIEMIKRREQNYHNKQRYTSATRNGVARIYEAKKLNDDEALMLFSQKAFKNDQPAEDFVELSKQIVGYANGLPPALEVIEPGRRNRLWTYEDVCLALMDNTVDELVELHMANSSLEQFMTPDLTGIPNLESLILEGCTSLSEVHPSLGHHKKLQYVNLVSCKSIRIIPSNLEMQSHKVFTLDGYSKLKFTDIAGNMNCLMELCLDGTGIAELSSSIHHLIGLGLLNMNNCKNLESIPNSIEVLGLSACNLREGALPEDIGCLSSLRSLDLSQNNFVSLPKSINQLFELEMLVLEDCTMLESLPHVPSKVQTGLSNPRPGFGIDVPGNEIPGWFNHQCKGSSISAHVPSWSMGFVACVAFSANNESPSLFCHFKANGRENYPSTMCISCNSIPAQSDHIWLFFLSFDYLKELKEWKHGSFSNIELSFHSYERRVKVNNYGVCLLSSLYITSQPSSAHFIVTSKEVASLYKASLVFSSSYHQWMANVFLVIRVADTSNSFSYLKSDLALRFIMPTEKEPEKVMAIRSRLFEAIEESRLSIVKFSRDCASLPWCFEELVKIVGFMDEMRSDTMFPVSYDVEQSKIDDQKESYTIVFDKGTSTFQPLQRHRSSSKAAAPPADPDPAPPPEVADPAARAEAGMNFQSSQILILTSCEDSSRRYESGDIKIIEIGVETSPVELAEVSLENCRENQTLPEF